MRTRDDSRSRRRALALLGSLAMVMTGCAGGGAAGDSTVSMRFGMIFAPGVPAVECGAEPMAENQKLRDLGFDISVFPSAQLGGENEMVQQVSTGQLEATLGTASIIASDFDFPELAFLEAYYLTDNAEQVFQVHAGQLATDLFAQLSERANLQRVGEPWLYGPRHMFGSRPLRTLEDFKGLRLRVPQVQVSIEGAQALGASPTPTAYSELYLALQQGIVEGAEAPASVIEAESFDEPAEFVSLTSHQISATPLVVNTAWWEALTVEQRQGLETAADETALAVAECVARSDQEAIDSWRESGEVQVVDDIDRAQLATAAREYFSEGFPFSSAYREAREALESAG